MQKHTLKRQMMLALLGVVILTASGCAGTGQNPAAQNLNPTVVVVQYVTQVVATVTPAPPTPTRPPATPEPVTVVNTGFDPYRVEVYYPLMGCPVASRIRVGDRVTVANNRGGTLGLHMSANVGYAPIFRSLGGGEILNVVDGPFCRTESLVWEVIDGEGEKGFVSEGNGEVYWLLPIGEKVERDLLRATPDRGVRMGLPKNCPPR
jgi:hypothetical protein